MLFDIISKLYGFRLDFRNLHVGILLMTFIGFIQIRKSIWNALLSSSVLFLLGFEAWLGKLVVDGNLVPNQITIHMMGSVAIVLLFLVLRARNDNATKALPKSILRTLVVLLLAVVVQIFLGTQTRELVDAAVDHGILNRFEILFDFSDLAKIHLQIRRILFTNQGLQEASLLTQTVFFIWTLFWVHSR